VAQQPAVGVTGNAFVYALPAASITTFVQLGQAKSAESGPTLKALFFEETRLEWGTERDPTLTAPFFEKTRLEWGTQWLVMSRDKPKQRNPVPP